MVYYKATLKNQEMVELELADGTYYRTVCIVDVKEMLSGKNTFPCANGDNLTLNRKTRAELISFINNSRDIEDDKILDKIMESMG